MGKLKISHLLKQQRIHCKKNPISWINVEEHVWNSCSVSDITNFLETIMENFELQTTYRTVKLRKLWKNWIIRHQTDYNCIYTLPPDLWCSHQLYKCLHCFRNLYIYISDICAMHIILIFICSNGCTTLWTYLIPLTHTLKNGLSIVNFVMYILLK